jgi:hypothetical protein
VVTSASREVFFIVVIWVFNVFYDALIFANN